MKKVLVVLPFLLLPSLAHANDDIADRIVAMAKMGSASAPTFSPDGSKLAYLTNISGSPQVWIVPAAGGYPQAVTAFDDPVGGVSWSPRGDRLAVLVAPGGGLNSQIWLMRSDGTERKRITPGGKENNWLGVWSDDGSLLSYSSNVRSGDSMDGYLYDVAKDESRLVARNKGIGRITDISNDNTAVLVNRMASRGNNDVFVVDVATGKEVIATAHTGPGNFAGAFGRDRSIVYLTTDKDRDLAAFGRTTIAGGTAGPIEVLASRTDAPLDGFDINEKKTHAVLIWNAGGRSEAEVIDLSTGKRQPAPRLPGDNLFDVTFAPGDRSVALVISGSGHPTDIWMWDNFDPSKEASAVLRQLTRSPHAGVALDSLIAPELVRYKAHDGLDLSGWLYLPRGASKSLPVVFSFHGGPEGQERPSLNSTYQALLSRGIAVFAPNVRGSSGFGKAFVNLDNGALRVNSVRDIEASVKALVERGTADPKRLGIMGGSYGGYMVMAGLTEYPDMFAAGANLFGVVNFETFFAQSEPWMAEVSTIEYGNPKTELAMLKSLSPINKIDRVKSPTLVLHGANDTNVPVVEAEQVVNRLKERGVPVEYVLFPDEGHGWRKTPNRVKSATTITRFFETHLKK